MSGPCIQCKHLLTGNLPNKQHLECHAMTCAKKPDLHPVAVRKDESMCGQAGRWFESK
jgi:hypothetical protein